MSPPTTRTRTRRRPLDRARIVRAAIELADAEGPKALTMARLGRRLGVEAMSLYRHVRNKDDLLDGMVDVVYDEIELPPDGPWRAWMRARSISAREVLARHPWAIELMESRLTPGPANLQHHDAVAGALFAAGFNGAWVTHAYNLLDSYIYGFAIQEVTLPFTTAEELAEVGDALLSRIPDVYPNLKRIGAEIMAAGFGYGDEFEFGLDIVLDGLERAHGEATGAP